MQTDLEADEAPPSPGLGQVIRRADDGFEQPGVGDHARRDRHHGQVRPIVVRGGQGLCHPDPVAVQRHARTGSEQATADGAVTELAEGVADPVRSSRSPEPPNR